MVLLPLMQFAFDTDWPTADATVFMTPTKVWGPLSIGLAGGFLFTEWWMGLVGVAITAIAVWVDPRFWEKIEWKEARHNG